MNELARVIAELTEGLAAGASLLVLTDYDGTLTPLVGDPTAARLEAEVLENLRLLARSPRTRIGILSGRALRDLRARVGVPEVIYAGCHGLEVEGPDISFRHPEAEAQGETLKAVTRVLGLHAGSIPGARLEPKGLAVAVHYRTVPPGAVARLQAQVERTIREQGSRLQILRGHKVMEILPRVRWNKGDCALWIRDQVLLRLPPLLMMLYMGDDWTDELAFQALSGKAITVRVGSAWARSSAVYQFHEVADVHRLLSALTAIPLH